MSRRRAVNHDPEEPQDAAIATVLAADLIEEDLIEEVSIDGMCGVY
jgi:mycofactocin precursor